ncbi:MAG: GNAT family N-acetyltransferase [Elusimicrobia bacterium]|nr:GNAT family N-acetyltransferase [Candidatus Obscuribacterium magneticum]
MVSFKPLPWDTKVYGFNFFELSDFDETSYEESEIKFIRENNPKVIYARISPHQIRATRFLEEHGYRYAEVQLDLRIKDFDKKPSLAFIHEVQPLSTTDKLDAVFDICLHAFDTNRYFLDPDFDRDLSGQRYANWVKNSLGRDGVHICQYKVRKEPVGFFMADVKKDDETGRYSLGGVHPKAKGQGIFTAMIGDMISYLRQKAPAIKALDTCVSLNNRKAFNIYLKHGFTVFSENVIFCKKF